MNRMQNIQFMSFSCYFYFSSFFGVASNDAHADAETASQAAKTATDAAATAAGRAEEAEG